VLIVSDSPIGIITGSGVIIGKTTVLTVAHIMNDRIRSTEVTFTSVFVQTKEGLHKLKVKSVYFS